MDILKYIVFGVALVVGVPTLAGLAYAKRPVLRWLAFVAVFLSFEHYYLSLNFFPAEEYRGTARGMEITATDMLMWSLLLALLLIYRFRFRLLPHGSWLYLLYFFWSSLSLFNAASQLYSFFELWKMLMMWLCFLALANYLYLTRDIEPILKGMGAVVIWAFVVVIRQKYILGYFQTPSIFAHQNTAGLYMAIIGPLFLTRWLNEHNATRWNNIFYGAAFLFSGAIAFFTFSRGAIVSYPLGCAVALLLSLGHRISKRKLQILLFVGICATLGLVKMSPRIILRFERAPESSKDMRVRLAQAAFNMANDKKFIGVGINNWGLKINPPFDYAKDREELEYDEDYKDSLVETIYLMVAAECGWVGFGFLLLCFIGFFLLSLVNWFRTYRTNINYLPSAICGGLLAAYAQSWAEWVLKQTPAFYALMMVFAITSAVSMIMSANGGKIPAAEPLPSTSRPPRAVRARRSLSPRLRPAQYRRIPGGN
ncbi:MAG: O-antigen ligase family protein [Lentisphaeria bacterium]|jgi:hypothetical protein